MKTLLFNIPYKDRIVRRFICSYNSPTFLFPPNELLGLGGIIKEWKGDLVELLDCVAESLNLDQSIKRIVSYNPDIIVSVIGFECFKNDIEILEKIKNTFPNTKVICFGYYPTIFSKEILERTDIDFILLNEPEITFSNLYDCIKNKKEFDNIEGIAFKEGKTVIVNKVSERIMDLDSLPYPFHGLLKRELYSEACLGGPVTTVQSSRGCPFFCNYCVRTYGQQVVYRSPENIISEIEEIVKLGIRKIRFLDDTFNIKKDRVIKICNRIIEKKLKIEWTSLSRVDTLDRENLSVMKASGCKRIYLGIESGSQKILDYYQKGYNRELIKNQVRLIKDVGIETTAFFLVGAPVETEEDLEQSISLAKDIGFDYIIVTKLTPYPGTELFEKIKNDIDFQLFPYKNQFKDIHWDEKIFDREKRFYTAFYFRFSYFKSRFWKFLKRPQSLIPDIINFLFFLFFNRRKERKDYL